MGDILILRANYVVGTQDIDVAEYVTTERDKNYGAIKFAVQKLDDDLRKDHRIVAPPPADAAALALSPPRLSIDYTDASGAFHTKSYTLTETVELGERTTYGKFVQRPGDVIWNVGLTAAKGQFLFVFVMLWALIVAWSFKQWEFLEGAYNSGAIQPYPVDDLGLVGKYVAIFAFYIFRYGGMVGKPLEFLLGGATVKEGWIMKFFFGIFAALTPVSSFFFQFLIWFTLVQSLLSRK